MDRSSSLEPTVPAAFDLATAVPEHIVPPWAVELGAGTGAVEDGTHGGFIAALGVRAMSAVVADPHRLPRTLTLELMASVEPGIVTLHPQLVRAGAAVSSTSLLVEREGVVVATGLGTFGRGESHGPRHDGPAMPSAPAPEDCGELPAGTRSSSDPSLIELRAVEPFSPCAELLLWMRLREPRPLDAVSACVLADAAPPSLLAARGEFVPVPTIDYTVHFAEVEAAQSHHWALGVFRTGRAADGFLVEDGELWTPDGHLILQTRQLRHIVRST
jgi:acyl-CoA thioesterase